MQKILEKYFQLGSHDSHSRVNTLFFILNGGDKNIDL